MKLITLTTPQLDTAALSAICAPGDCILLRQDAVYLCLQPALALPVPLLALASDVQWRNIEPQAKVELIDDARWVELCASANQNLLWN